MFVENLKLKIMDEIIVLLLIAILALPIILLIVFKVSITSHVKEAILKIHSLNVKVDKLREDIVSPKVVSEEDNSSINERVERLLDIVPEEKKLENRAKKQDIKTEKVEEVKKEPVIEEVKPQPKLVKPIAPKVEQPKPAQKAAFVKPPKKKRDIEKFVGENLLNKIGIGVLVLGIAYFVKFAIDKNWIGEVGRVAIGILSGGLLTFLAHKIRKTYKAFSSVLVGGALAVFYYTISIAFHDYQLFSQPVAFSLMVVITAFSVLLSVSYDKKELAILALIGAFSTPLMLSTGAGDYRILFSYLAIVNVGMLVLAYFKKWNVVNILSLSFTIILYGGWFVAKVVGGINPPYQGALIFAALFYVIFFFMHVVNNVKEKRKFKGYEFGLLLGTTGLFYGVGMSIFNMSGNTNLQGLFTVVLGVFNLLFAYPLYKRNSVDRSLVFLLVGMVLTFVSLAAPVQLSGNYITLFWATEMVLLLWLAQKSGIAFMKFSSLAIFGLTLGSLFMDWGQIYGGYGELLPLIINKGFITNAFSIIGVAAYIKLLNKETGDKMVMGISVNAVKTIAQITFAGLIYFAGALELGYQLNARIGNDSLTTLSVLAYSFVYLLGLSLYAKRTEDLTLQKYLGLTQLVAISSYPLFNLFEQQLRNQVLYGHIEGLALMVNYINLGLIVLMGVQFVRNIKSTYGFNSITGRAALWGMSFLGLVILSMHLNHQTVTLFYDAQLENMSFINKQTIKIGYPILWGVSSFMLMLVGMKYKFRTLRIVSLSIFGLLLLKLFMFDIKGASEAGKIVAFILLGVLLLVISFMYQKLKNLILDDKNDK